MSPRQPLPRLWLMTDERLGDALLPTVRGLPAEAGIVFRHYSLAPAERRALFDRVREAAGERLLLLAGPAADWRADGSHGRGRAEGLRTAPAHDLAEIRAAEDAGAALIFLSPVFATRSHPSTPTLGPERFAALAAQTKLPVVALGGMNEERFATLEHAYGWAAIDAWTASTGA